MIVKVLERWLISFLNSFIICQVKITFISDIRKVSVHVKKPYHVKYYSCSLNQRYSTDVQYLKKLVAITVVALVFWQKLWFPLQVFVRQ